MVRVREDCIICLCVKGAAQKRRVSFNGKDGDVVEGRDKVGNATNAEAMFHGIGDPPASGRNGVFVVAESDEWWCGIRIFVVMKFGEEVLSSSHVVGGATVRDGFGGG